VSDTSRFIAPAARVTIDAQSARITSAAFVAGGALYAVLPHHPGIPCPFRALTGLPCPLCGMTRAVTAAMRGDVWASLRYHPAGIVLIAVALFLLFRPRRVDVRLPAWLIPVALALMWAWNLTLNPTFH
jgi:hypothetical protein